MVFLNITSNSVPIEGVVYVTTEPEVTLQAGHQGILPCLIPRRAFAVYWKKGPRYEDSELFAYIDQYYNVGEKGGAGYDQGYFDINHHDQSFDLVIKHVVPNDEGLYFCEVSDFEIGAAFRNQTTVYVNDWIVDMDRETTLMLGTTGRVTCSFFGTPFTVFWSKGDSLEEASLVITWNKGTVQGPRFDDGSCDVDEEYSLIVRDVHIVDGGRYFCRVVNYQGILIGNHTDVQVIASPQGPFPVIAECQGQNKPVDNRACSIKTSSKTTITCSVMRFYPTINLFFRQASKTMATSHQIEWISSDGTFNKNVSVEVEASDELYQCVAADIPGIDGQQTTGIRIKYISVGSTMKTHTTKIPAVPDKSNGWIIALAVLLPIFAIGVGICLFIWRRNSRMRVQRKSGDASNIEQEPLKDICMGGASSTLRKPIKEDGNASSTRLKPVKMDDDASSIELEPSMEIGDASSTLLKPMKEYGDASSIQLESLKEIVMSDASSTLLKPMKEDVSDDQKAPITGEDVKDFIRKLTGRHCTRLIKYIITITESVPKPQINQIVEENQRILFNTPQMLLDWLSVQKCSNYEKRQRIILAGKAVGRHDLREPYDSGRVCADEIAQIAAYLTSGKSDDLCDKLQTLDRAISHQYLEQNRQRVEPDLLPDVQHSDLLKALKEVEFDGLIPNIRTQEEYVYKAYLVDIAFHLFMKDVLPFAAELGITGDELTKYRPPFQPDHLTKGTVNLVLQLFKKTRDSTKEVDKHQHHEFIKFLQQGGHLDIAHMSACDYDCTFGELEAIAEVILNLSEKNVESTSPKESAQDKSCTLPGSHETKANYREETDSDDESATASKMKPKMNTGDVSLEESKNGEHKSERAESAMRNDRNGKQTLDPHHEATSYEEVNESQITITACASQDDENASSKEQLLTQGTHFVFKKKLGKMLNLTDDEMQECMEGDGAPDVVAMLFKWKRRIRPAPFHYRSALAEVLQDLHPEVTAKIIAGDFRSKNIGSRLVNDMVAKMNLSERQALCKLLGLGGTKKDEISSADDVSNKIVTWSRKWVKEMEPSYWTKFRDAVFRYKKTLRSHRDFNNKLVENGFLELAHEIMVFERQLLS